MTDSITIKKTDLEIIFEGLGATRSVTAQAIDAIENHDWSPLSSDQGALYDCKIMGDEAFELVDDLLNSKSKDERKKALEARLRTLNKSLDSLHKRGAYNDCDRNSGDPELERRYDALLAESASIEKRLGL